MSQVFFVDTVMRRETKHGKAYAAVRLMDVTGYMDLKIWNFDPLDYPEFTGGKYAVIRVKVQSFRDSLQLVAESNPMLVEEPENKEVYEDSF